MPRLRSLLRASDLLSVAIALGVTGALVALLALCWLHRVFTVDDAFITLRYASNLAHGDGPTWNPGGKPVEGYTTFLWMLLTTIPHLLRVDAIGFAKIAGVAAAIACMAAAAALAHELARGASREAHAAAAGVAAIVVGASTSTAVHAVSGMETTLFTALVTAFGATLLRWQRRAGEGSTRRAFVPALVGLAAGLTRPEGNLLVAVAFVVAVAALPSRASRVLARAAAVGWLLPYGLYFSWRLSYYGLLAPLSFYVKAANEPGLFRGVDEVVGVLHMLSVVQPHLGVALLVGAVARARRAAPVLLAVAAFVAFFLVPAPIMAYERRYLFPVFPSIFAISAAGLAVTIDWIARSCARWRTAVDPATLRRRVAAFAVAALSALAALDVHRHARGSIEGFSAYGEGLLRAHVRLALDLRARQAGEGATLTRTVALVDVGAVAYVSGWRTIDTFGLNDAHVARSGRRDPEYVEAQDPDVVVFLSRRADRLDPHLAWEQAIHDDFVARGYEPLSAYGFAPDYYLLALTRPVARTRGAGRD